MDYMVRSKEAEEASVRTAELEAELDALNNEGGAELTRLRRKVEMLNVKNEVRTAFCLSQQLLLLFALDCSCPPQLLLFALLG